MKKLVTTIIAVLMALFMITISNTANKILAVSLSDSIIMQLTETHTDNQIDISVKLVTNTGITGMTLELVYNKNVFEYVGYEKGTALEDLDLIVTDVSSNPNLPVKFNWLSQNVHNDFSTGNMLKIHFALKPDSPSGDYEIGFKYNDGDITYIDGINLLSKSAIISKAIVNIAENKITETKIIEDSIDNKTNLLLVLGVVAVTISVAVVTTLIILKTKRGKGKKNWLKI